MLKPQHGPTLGVANPDGIHRFQVDTTGNRVPRGRAGERIRLDRDAAHVKAFVDNVPTDEGAGGYVPRPADITADAAHRPRSRRTGINLRKSGPRPAPRHHDWFTS